MICYSVFGCCSTWWAEPGKQFTWISSIMNNVYGFLFHQLFWVTFYWFSVTRSKLVYLLDKKPDIWTVAVALLHGLFMVICSVEHFYHFRPMWMNWSELYLLWFSVHLLDFFMCMYAQKYKFYRCFLVQNAFFLVYLSWLCIWL